MKKMRNILGSVAVIAAVATLGYVGTSAYFSDTEESKDNVLTTGTIDIAVDGTNPWSSTKKYVLDDMKPGYVDYLNFTLSNVADNPANIWKDVTVTSHVNEPVSEPECGAENGTWTPDSENPYLGTCADNGVIANLEDVVDYDLKVKIRNTEGTVVWEQIIYNEDITLAEAYKGGGNGLYLGMLPAGWTMDVEQSYRMKEVAGNEYQGDSISFDITLYAEQLINTVRLENKNKSMDWKLVLSDDYYADLVYGVKEKEFTYTLRGKAPLSGTSYTLLFYPETWTVPGHTANTANIVLGTTTSGTDGTVNMAGSVDLGYDLNQMKVWLVPSSYVDEGGVITTWEMQNFLFETGLIDYYDTGL